MAWLPHLEPTFFLSAILKTSNKPSLPLLVLFSMSSQVHLFFKVGRDEGSCCRDMLQRQVPLCELLHISCYIIVTQGIIMIVLINTIFLPLCKQKLYIIAIFCIGSSSVLLVIQYFYQFFN